MGLEWKRMEWLGLGWVGRWDDGSALRRYEKSCIWWRALCAYID